MKQSDEAFDKKAKAVFDESVEELDAATLSKLNRGRHAALAELHRPAQQWSRWMPVTGVAAAVLIAVMVMQSPTAVDDAALSTAATDMEILLGEDSIEMLEDLEFYSWIDSVELDSDVG
jgi:hypothetical protein